MSTGTRMGIIISFFESREELSKYVEQQLAEAKNTMLSHSRRLSEAQKRYDLEGGGQESKKKREKQDNTKQSDIAGFKVLINPTANYELNLLDEATKSVQEKIEVLDRIRNQFLPSLKNGKIAAILDDGIPTAFMHYPDK
jgi:hypothetical protein